MVRFIAVLTLPGLLCWQAVILCGPALTGRPLLFCPVELLTHVRAKGNGENGSTLEVRTETVLRRYTRSGWVEDGRPASPAVQQSGKALLDRCSGPAAG